MMRLETHCPDCFQATNADRCRCGYARDSERQRPNDALPLFHSLAGGRYTVGRILGQGSFSIVYSVYDKQEKCGLALKEFYPRCWAKRDSGGIKPFKEFTKYFNAYKQRQKQEADLLRRCQDHPVIEGIVRHSHNFSEQGNFYVVMERVTGKSLKEVLNERRFLTANEVLTWLPRALTSMRLLHGRGIFHRDLSPGNLYFRMHGHRPDFSMPVLMDFGMGRFDDEESVNLTPIYGTKGFRAPEIVSRSEGIDGKCDVYSLGALIYSCLVGKPPCDVTMRGLNERLHAISNMQGKEAKLLAELAMDCLQMDRNKRPGANDILTQPRYASLWDHRSEMEIVYLESVPSVEQEPNFTDAKVSTRSPGSRRDSIDKSPETKKTINPLFAGLALLSVLGAMFLVLRHPWVKTNVFTPTVQSHHYQTEDANDDIEPSMDDSIPKPAIAAVAPQYFEFSEQANNPPGGQSLIMHARFIQNNRCTWSEPLGTVESLAKGECFNLQVRLTQPAYLSILYRNSGGDWEGLCAPKQIESQTVPGGEKALRIDGDERFWVVAMQNKAIMEQWQNLLSGSGCDATFSLVNKQRLPKLRTWMSEHIEGMDWRYVHLSQN